MKFSIHLNFQKTYRENLSNTLFSFQCLQHFALPSLQTLVICAVTLTSPPHFLTSSFFCLIGKRFVSDDSVCVLGISKRNLLFQPVAELKKETDFE